MQNYFLNQLDIRFNLESPLKLKININTFRLNFKNLKSSQTLNFHLTSISIECIFKIGRILLSSYCFTIILLHTIFFDEFSGDILLDTDKRPNSVDFAIISGSNSIGLTTIHIAVAGLFQPCTLYILGQAKVHITALNATVHCTEATLF